MAVYGLTADDWRLNAGRYSLTKPEQKRRFWMGFLWELNRDFALQERVKHITIDPDNTDVQIDAKTSELILPNNIAYYKTILLCARLNREGSTLNTVGPNFNFFVTCNVAYFWLAYVAVVLLAVVHLYMTRREVPAMT